MENNVDRVSMNGTDSKSGLILLEISNIMNINCVVENLMQISENYIENR